MDRYDTAYRRGYSDGLNGKPKTPPTDDSKINYDDGYQDGEFKRREDQTP